MWRKKTFIATKQKKHSKVHSIMDVSKVDLVVSGPGKVKTPR